jgi:pyrroline-5-carboxylate reductase
MKPIGFIGAGNMAEAIISGLIKKALIPPREIKVFDIKPERMDHLRSGFGIECAASVQELVRTRDIIILAIKPDQIATQLQGIKESLAGKLIISIAAGVTLKSMLDVLGAEAKIVRVMPNTPALVLEGATVIAASSSCAEQEKEIAKEIFLAVGICLEMEEKFINAVTALSGSGPAFCFLFLEAMCDGAVKAGLPRDVALRLAAATMKGAGAMVLELSRVLSKFEDHARSPLHGCPCKL